MTAARRRRRLQTPRVHRVSIRLSDAEWDAVRAQAHRDRLSVGAWIAETLVERPADTSPDSVDSSALRAVLAELNQARTQLAKAGGLLNQAVGRRRRCPAEHPGHPPDRLRRRRHRRHRRRLAGPRRTAAWQGGALRRQLSALLRPRAGGHHRHAGGADRLTAPLLRRPGQLEQLDVRLFVNGMTWSDPTAYRPDGGRPASISGR
jgi:predicted DNA-binding ribbon-helix-helix protein